MLFKILSVTILSITIFQQTVNIRNYIIVFSIYLFVRLFVINEFIFFYSNIQYMYSIISKTPTGLFYFNLCFIHFSCYISARKS